VGPDGFIVDCEGRVEQRYFRRVGLQQRRRAGDEMVHEAFVDRRAATGCSECSPDLSVEFVSIASMAVDDPRKATRRCHRLGDHDSVELGPPCRERNEESDSLSETLYRVVDGHKRRHGRVKVGEDEVDGCLPQRFFRGEVVVDLRLVTTGPSSDGTRGGSLEA
jgi:hypothetical protein